MASACSATALAAEGPSVHGQLRVQGSQLTDAKGQPVVLRGMSTHGMQWFPQFANGAAFHELHKAGEAVFRMEGFLRPLLQALDYVWFEFAHHVFGIANVVPVLHLVMNLIPLFDEIDA